MEKPKKMVTKRRVAKALANTVGKKTYSKLKRRVGRKKAGRIAKAKARKTYRWAMKPTGIRSRGRRSMKRRPMRSRRMRRY
jgi:hypothetical protein